MAELGTDPNHWLRDFDSNGTVDNIDFSWLGSYWLDVCNEPNWCGGSDLNKSGAVDNNDLRIFGQSWLSPFAAGPLWCDPWNNPRQCHGDADGSAVGSTSTGYYYVGSEDLNILYATLGSRYGGEGPPAYDGQADFDRDGDVDEDDGDILIKWYQVKEPPFGSGVPTDCPPEFKEQHINQ